MRTSRVLRGSAASCLVSAVIAGSHPIEQRGLLQKCNVTEKSSNLQRIVILEGTALTILCMSMPNRLQHKL